jgi:hypothetical protein
MSEMVERVARALAEQFHEPDVWNDKWVLDCARAAIGAMREPTDTVKSLFSDGHLVWNAMINEALR